MAKKTGGSTMGLKEARELAELIRQQSVLSKGLRAYTAIVTLDDRITELEAEIKQILNEFDEVEAQRDKLFKVADEMLDLIESTDFEDDDGCPNNDDMNRWHGALQDAKIKQPDVAG